MLLSLLFWAKLTIALISTSLPLNFSHFCFQMWLWHGFGFEQKYWWINGFGEKKRTYPWICILLFTPLLEVLPQRFTESKNK